VDIAIAPTPRRAPGQALADLHVVCPADICRTIFAHGAGLPEAAFQEHLQRQSRLWRQEQAKAARIKARREAEEQEIADLVAALAQRRPADPPPDLGLVVPSGRARTRPLSDRRRQRYLAHLDGIVAAACAEPPPPHRLAPAEAATEQGSALPGRLCAACGGGCCTLGGDTAYLTEATIRRVMATHPELNDPDSLRAAYAARLPEQTVASSCINHTDQGCSLPRELRADTCNDFACPSLQTLRDSLRAAPPVSTVLVLRRRRSVWQRMWDESLSGAGDDTSAATLLTESGSRRVPLPRRD